MLFGAVLGCGDTDRTLGDGSGTRGDTGIESFASSASTGLDGSGPSFPSTGSNGDTVAEPGDGGILYDIGTDTASPSCPSPSGCPLGPSTVIVEQDLTPTGPQPVMYAAFGEDYCYGELRAR